MYFIRRNQLLGLAIVLCYLAVILYTAKLEEVSLSGETHVYGTEQAYGRAVVERRVSLSDIREMAQVRREKPQSRYSGAENSIAIGSYNEFSSVKTRASVTAKLEALRKLHRSPNYKVELEKRRLSSMINTAIFFLALTITLLVLSGDNHKREFDGKMIFLSALILLNLGFIAGQLTLLMPLIGLALLYTRQYLSTNFSPHQE